MGNSERQTLDYSTLKHLPISLPYYSGSVCTHGDKELLPEPPSDLIAERLQIMILLHSMLLLPRWNLATQSLGLV